MKRETIPQNPETLDNEFCRCRRREDLCSDEATQKFFHHRSRANETDVHLIASCSTELQVKRTSLPKAIARICEYARATKLKHGLSEAGEA